MENLTVNKKPTKLNGGYAMNKPSLRCHKCSTVFHYRIRRGWFLKYVLFFLPIKIYFCGHCVKNRYILLSDKNETKYNPV
jgi:hypothetical protein